MGLFSFWNNKSQNSQCVKCYSIDRSISIEVYVDDTQVYYKKRVIGEYYPIEDNKVVVKTIGNEIVFKLDEFVSFINNTRNKRLASAGGSVRGGDLTGPTVEVNEKYISSIDGDLLASFNGNMSKALVAFICCHAIVFDGMYHDYFAS